MPKEWALTGAFLFQEKKVYGHCLVTLPTQMVVVVVVVVVVAFSSRARILGECLTNHFPPPPFF